MRSKKILYISLGVLSLGLGALGAVLPLLPAFPFLMLAAFCFGRSSEKLDRWFKSTKLYQNNLETYVKGQGMTWKTKIRVMVTVTLLMSFGFLITIFYKGIMPSEKILDLPVDCNTLTGSVNLGYENINHLALIVKAHGIPIIQIARNAVNL